MVDNWVTIKIRSSTLKLLDEPMKATFLAHHPEFEGMTLTRNFLLLKSVNYYIEH